MSDSSTHFNEALEMLRADGAGLTGEANVSSG